MKRESSAILAIAAAVSLGGCSRRQTIRHEIETARVVSPAVSLAVRYRTAGSETRPSTAFPESRRFSVSIPPGPRRVLRTAVFDGEEANGAERVSALLHDDDPETPAALSTSTTASSGTWTSWEFEVPATGKESSLEFHLSPGTPHPEDVALARPTLSAPARRSPRIFILFDVDTLRKDRLSLYGYSRPTTPKIDRFFRKGTVWTNAFSNAPWTLPSHVTMFTSTLPNEHGVGTRSNWIPRELPTLAEVLRRAGYRTIAITGGGYVAPSWGFYRGFDSYRTFGETVGEAIALLEREVAHYAGEPLFVFFHTYHVHNYSPSAKGARKLFGSLSPLGPGWREDIGDSARSLFEAYPLDRVSRWLGNRYDASLVDVDDGFGELVAWLREEGLAERTGVMLTADHGENLYDRPFDSRSKSELGHGHPFLYDEYLRVPLASRIPWRKPEADPSANVSLLDVAPSILAALDVPPPREFRGRSLLNGTRGPGRSRAVVSDSTRYDSIAVRIGHRVLMRHSPTAEKNPWTGEEYGTLPAFECFDTAADPQERTPLPCANEKPLEIESSRYLAARFPGSLVFRLDARPGSEFALEAEERTGRLHADSFGLRKEGEVWTEGRKVRARFHAAAGPLWLALTPRVPGDAISVRFYSTAGEPLVSRDSLEIPGTATWSSLRWPPGELFRNPITVFTTGRRGRSAVRPVPGSLVRKLRSLGYLAAGSEAGNRPDEPDGAAAPGPSPARTIRIDVFSTLPAWTYPGESPLAEAHRFF